VASDTSTLRSQRIPGRATIRTRTIPPRYRLCTLSVSLPVPAPLSQASPNPTTSGDVLRNAHPRPRHENVTDSARGATMTRLRDPSPDTGPIRVTNPFSGFDEPENRRGGDLWADVHPEIIAATIIRIAATPTDSLRGEKVGIFNVGLLRVCQVFDTLQEIIFSRNSAPDA
jgi:hypothetical protein